MYVCVWNISLLLETIVNVNIAIDTARIIVMTMVIVGSIVSIIVTWTPKVCKQNCPKFKKQPKRPLSNLLLRSKYFLDSPCHYGITITTIVVIVSITVTTIIIIIPWHIPTLKLPYTNPKGTQSPFKGTLTPFRCASNKYPLPRSITQRVQAPNISGLWFQKPYA